MEKDLEMRSYKKESKAPGVFGLEKRILSRLRMGFFLTRYEKLHRKESKHLTPGGQNCDL